jgi:hypothetical protein
VKKAMVLSFAVYAIAVSAACGGHSNSGSGPGKGHSAAYNQGYQAGDNFTNMQLQMATMSCAMAYEQAKGGLNIDEFGQGCVDAAQKHGAVFDDPTDNS